MRYVLRNRGLFRTISNISNGAFMKIVYGFQLFDLLVQRKLLSIEIKHKC